MTHFKTLRTTVCLAALFSASTAMADVTAEQVWADWQESLAIYGEDGVSIGAVETGDGTVTVSDLMFSMQDDFTSAEANLGTLTFVEQGDGTVAVTMADSYPMTISPESGVVISIEVSQSGMEMIVSGSENDMTYDVTADRYAFNVLEITEDGEQTVDGDMLIAANNLAGTYNVLTDDLRTVDYDITVGSLDLLVEVTEPGGEGRANVSGKMDAMEISSVLAMPADADTQDPDEMFANGMSIEGGYDYAGAAFIFEIVENGDSASGSFAMGPGSAAIAMDNAAMSYAITATELAVNMQTSDLPFPVQIALAEYGTGFAMPLSATDEPADFAMSLDLVDLTVNDEIWAMGDPAQVLPRDPATIKLDLTGQAKLFFDILDPEQAAAMEMADAPGEIYALNLNELLLSAGGAMVTGAGAFTFDNSDLQTFNGVPRPEGDATITISGANGLIDNLVSMGLLPQDQASMGRMMMGMFARSVGDDELETKVEVNAEGHLIVNGQRMQ